MWAACLGVKMSTWAARMDCFDATLCAQFAEGLGSSAILLSQTIDEHSLQIHTRFVTGHVTIFVPAKALFERPSLFVNTAHFFGRDYSFNGFEMLIN